MPQKVLNDPMGAIVKALPPSPENTLRKSADVDNSSLSSESSNHIEDIITQKLKEAMKRSNRAKREFFSGCKF